MDDFRLRSCYGNEVSLSDYADSNAVAIVYLGTECPLAKLYGNRLTELQQKYAEKGVQVTYLAHGVPVGGELDHLDDGTLAAALRARRTSE